MVQAVFQPLGRRAPLELSSERRLIKKALSAQNFSGYPTEPLDREDLKQISSLSYDVITRLVLSFIQEPLEAQGLIRDEQRIRA